MRLDDIKPSDQVEDRRGGGGGGGFGLPGGGGPAHADGVRAVSAVTVKAMTWNVCGAPGPSCPLGAQPAELTKRIVQQMNGTEIGGRKVRPTTVFLQEICAGQVRTLRKTGRLARWSWAFAPFRSSVHGLKADPQDRPDRFSRQIAARDW